MVTHLDLPTLGLYPTLFGILDTSSANRYGETGLGMQRRRTALAKGRQKGRAMQIIGTGF